MEKSKETLLWEELIENILSWKKNNTWMNNGKFMCSQTRQQFIRGLKHRYYLDLMKHSSFKSKNFSKVVEIDLDKLPKNMNITEFLDLVKNNVLNPTQASVDSYLDYLTSGNYERK